MRRGRGMGTENEDRKEEWEQKRIVINKSKRRMYIHMIHVPTCISTVFPKIDLNIVLISLG